MGALFATAGIAEMSDADAHELLMDLVFLAGLFVLVPWFFLAVFLWFASHLHLLRQRRLGVKHVLGFLLFVSPTAAWGCLIGRHYIGGPWTFALLALVGLTLAGLLLIAGRLATETAYECPLCGTERMRLANSVDADPHSAGGSGGVFRCRGCGNRWLLTPAGWGSKKVPDVRSLE